MNAFKKLKQPWIIEPGDAYYQDTNGNWHCIPGKPIEKVIINGVEHTVEEIEFKCKTCRDEGRIFLHCACGPNPGFVKDGIRYSECDCLGGEGTYGPCPNGCKPAILD